MVSAVLLIFSNSVIAEEVLSWGECIKEAAKNHPDLIAAIEETKQSVAGKDITASTLFPQIDSSLSASTAKTVGSAKGGTTDSYSYGVTGTQLIFDGTKTIQDVKAAKENINASKENFKYTSVIVRYNLRSAFIGLLKEQKALNITQEIYEIRRSNLELITLRYQSGLEHRGALLTAEADLANAKYQVSQAQRNLEVARRKLIREMGRQKLTPVFVKGDFQVSDVVKEKPDFETIAQNNPSLSKIIAQKNSAAFSLKSAYANFSPSLSGQAGANKTSSSWPPENDAWNAGLTLSMPIFEGGLRLAQVSKAKAYLNQLKENERSIKDGIILTLEQKWALLQDAIDNAEVQYETLIATEERSKIAQAEFSVGFISFDNWTIIENNLVTQKSAYLDAQANALLAEAGWVQAKGETLEYE
ncbi:MAG: TolC family protein [Candidatus Omnitrophota bacterium]|jgi:outer membrane protein TolC